MKIGRIVEAQRVEGAKRLVKLTIDLGGATKQSVASLGEQYEPEALRDRLVAVVTNLAPKRIFGLTSEVMLLAAIDGETISILKPDKPVSVGSKVV